MVVGRRLPFLLGETVTFQVLCLLVSGRVVHQLPNILWHIVIWGRFSLLINTILYLLRVYSHHRTFRLPAARQPLGKPRLTPCIAAAAPDFASALTMNCENGMFLVEFFEVNRDKSVFGPWSVQHCMSVLDWFGGFLSGQFIINP